MTVAERKRLYTFKQESNRLRRKRELRLSPWHHIYILNPFVCRPIEDRKRAYELLTHSYLSRR